MGFSAIRMHIWYIFENLTDQGHNRTGFAILDSFCKDQEGKEGLQKIFLIFCDHEKRINIKNSYKNMLNRHFLGIFNGLT